MDKRVLIFVALICLISPSYGRSWLGPQEHPSDHGLGFKPYHHGGYGPDQDSGYDSSDEDWDGDDFTDHHRHPEGYEGHGYHHHVNHGYNYGSHEFGYHHHGHGCDHHDFRKHNHGSHNGHEEHHSHHPSLGSSHNNNDGYRTGNQDHGHNFGERRNSHEIFDLPQNNLGRDNGPNPTPKAIDNAGSPNTGSSIPLTPIVGPPILGANDRSESGSSVTESPKSGIPAGSPGLPQGPGSRGDSDRVVFPDGPPSPITTITSSPIQPRLLSTPEPTHVPQDSPNLTTQAPVTSAPITQAPVTQAPTQASTTPLLEVVKCVRACPVTSEYNPVCGSNNVTYNNPGLMECAKNCGVAVTMARQAPCPRPLPLPVLRFLAETLNVTVEEMSQRNKRATPSDAVTEPPKTSDPLTKVPIDPKDLPKLNFTLIDVLLSALDDDLELLKKLRSRVKSKE